MDASLIIHGFFTSQNLEFTPSSADQANLPFEVIISKFEGAGRLFLDHLDKGGFYSIRTIFVTRDEMGNIGSNIEKALDLDSRLRMLPNQLALQLI